MQLVCWWIAPSAKNVGRKEWERGGGSHGNLDLCARAVHLTKVLEMTKLLGGQA